MFENCWLFLFMLIVSFHVTCALLPPISGQLKNKKFKSVSFCSHNRWVEVPSLPIEMVEMTKRNHFYNKTKKCCKSQCMQLILKILWVDIFLNDKKHSLKNSRMVWTTEFNCKCFCSLKRQHHKILDTEFLSLKFCH